MQQNPLAAILGGQRPSFGANPTVANVINQRAKKRKLRSASKVATKGKPPVPGQPKQFPPGKAY